jgi:glycine betaine/proline transport system substrate-binding protein
VAQRNIRGAGGIRALWLVALTAIAGLVLAGCGGSNIKSTNTASGKSCGQFNIAVNPWVGYEADAYVVGTVAQQKLGCQVSYKNLKEEVSWQGFGSGDVDVVLENWGHPDLVKKYIKGNHTAEDAGPTGNIGVIGWYVPPWLAKAHPDILNWKNLNKYASKFKTSESGGKGQFLDGDPSFVTNDEALVKNLNLNFKVVYAGSETALIQAYRKAEKNHTWVIGYFYAPQWFLSEVPMKKVSLPKYTPGCDSNPAKIACDYPKYNLNKVVATRFAKSKSPAYTLVKNFHWTNDDQNLVAKYIAADHMNPADAAKKWIDANPDKVKAWLQGT